MNYIDAIKKAFSSDPLFIILSVSLPVLIGTLVMLIREYKRVSQEEEEEEILPEHFMPPPADDRASQDDINLARRMSAGERTERISTSDMEKTWQPTMPSHSQTDIMFSVLEDKFAELAVRIDQLESQKPGGTGGLPSQEFISSFEHRIAALEKEIEKLKFKSASGAGGDPEKLQSLQERVSGLQKMMEDLVREE